MMMGWGFYISLLFENSTNPIFVFLFFCFKFLFLPRICLVGEKHDKELPGVVGARGDTV